MLVSRRALELILADVDAVTAACAGLAEAHRATPMVARTLLQQALPTTFGLKAATWLAGVLEARRLVLGARDELALQLGGGAGTLAALGEHGPAIAARAARELGLAEPALPWHTARVRVAALGSALAILAGALGKVALDVVLLAQTEVGEVGEPSASGRGRSSTMPHKHNPVGSLLTLACARRAPGRRRAPDREPRAGARARRGRVAGGVGGHCELPGVCGRRGGEHGRGARRPGGAPRAHGRQPRRHARADHVGADRVRARRADRPGPCTRARQRGGRAGERARQRAARPSSGPSADLPLTAAELDALFIPGTYVGAAGEFVDRALELYRTS